MDESLFEKRTVEYPYDFAAGAIAAGNTFFPTVKEARIVDDATLDEDEVGELYAIEVNNPNLQPLEGVWVKVDDDRPYDDEVFANCYWNEMMLPPWQRVRHKAVVKLGKPASTDLLQNTTIKFRKNVRPVVLIGAGGTTDDFSVILHYYVYKTAAFGVRGIFGTLSGVVQIVDSTRNRFLNITKPGLQNRAVGPDIWDQLPGGKTQEDPKIFPLLRYGWNAKATTINRDYKFEYDDGEVSEERRNLSWEPKHNVIVIVEALGVRPHADSHFTALKISGQYMPTSRYYTTPTHNPLMFGEANTLLGWNEFFPIPRLPDPQVIMASSQRVPTAYQESGGVVHQTTAAVAANNIIAAIQGKVIYMT